MFRKTILTLCSLFLLFPVFAGGKKEAAVSKPEPAATPAPVAVVQEKPEIVRVAALNGPSSVGMAYLFENHPMLDGVASTFEVTATPDVFLPKLLKGEVDIGILPVNAAAKVYTKNNGALVMGGVVGQGMLFVVTRDASIKTLADLKGKKLTVAGQGSTPEYMFKYLAAQAGLAPTDVELDFSIPTAEIAPALIAGKINYALVPEPFATVMTMKDAALIRAINVQELYANVPGNSKNYPMTVAVVRKAFAQKYPQTVKQFLTAYEASINWTNANPMEAGKLVEKHTLGLNAPIVAKSVPNAAFVYQSAQDGRAGVEQLLSIFMTFAPEAVGGKLPDEGFYFK